MIKVSIIVGSAFFGVINSWAAIGNLVQVTQNTSLGMSSSPYSVRACCNAQGNAAYCSEYTVNTNAFDVTTAIGCQFAGVKLSPGFFPTNCAVQGNNFCTFSAQPGDVPRTLRVYQNVVVRSITSLVIENLAYGVQQVATGWPNQTPPNDWGFDGSGPVNFNLPGNHIEAELVAARPLNACTALTNAQALVGKIALVQRGVCDFGLKGLRVQNAGAIGFIVINNTAGLINMGGNLLVVIPGALITQSAGTQLLSLLNQGQKVSAVMGNIS